MEFTHQLRLKGHEYKYFHFLSTNRILFQGNEKEHELVAEYIVKRDSLHPVPEFANPLSVGVSLFCEDGASLVLTRRTDKESIGGTWEANSIFNAVAENISESDVTGSFKGKTRLSPWITAARGLREEMGFYHRDVTKYTIVLHSFVWDRRILDYKFFSYVVTDLSRSEIEKRWEEAPDKHENSKPFYFDTRSSADGIDLLKKLVQNKDEWSLEAIFSTVRSMLILGKITHKNLESVLMKN